MRSLNSQNKDHTTGIADTMSTFVLSSGTAEADDIPSGAQFMHISSDTKIFINLHSTAAIIPSASIAATTSSTGLNIVHNTGHEHVYEISSGSTGFSMISLSTGIATVEYFGK